MRETPFYRENYLIAKAELGGTEVSLSKAAKFIGRDKRKVEKEYPVEQKGNRKFIRVSEIAKRM